MTAINHAQQEGVRLKKRTCNRFSIPGTTLYFKNKPGLFTKTHYPDIYYPVINLSKGGTMFLCNDRLKAGQKIIVKINIPGIEQSLELMGDVRWISKNPEQSYKYRTGVEFNAYGNKAKENSKDLLLIFKDLETHKKTQ